MTFVLPKPSLTNAERKALEQRIYRERWGDAAEPSGFIPETPPPAPTESAWDTWYKNIVPNRVDIPDAPPAQLPPSPEDQFNIGLTPTGIGMTGSWVSQQTPTAQRLDAYQRNRPTGLNDPTLGLTSAGIGIIPDTPPPLPTGGIGRELDFPSPPGPMSPAVGTVDIPRPSPTSVAARETVRRGMPWEDLENRSDYLEIIDRLDVLQGLVDTPGQRSEGIVEWPIGLQEEVPPEEDPQDPLVWAWTIGRGGKRTWKQIPESLFNEAQERFIGSRPMTSSTEMLSDFFQSGALEHLFSPLDAFAMTVEEIMLSLSSAFRGDFGAIDAPTIFSEGFVASVEKFRAKPMWQQIILGIITDPVVMLKAFTLGAKLVRATTGGARSKGLIPLVGLFRREIAYAHPNLGDDAADEIADALAAQMDETIAKTPGGSTVRRKTEVVIGEREASVPSSAPEEFAARHRITDPEDVATIKRIGREPLRIMEDGANQLEQFRLRDRELDLAVANAQGEGDRTALKNAVEAKNALLGEQRDVVAKMWTDLEALGVNRRTEGIQQLLKNLRQNIQEATEDAKQAAAIELGELQARQGIPSAAPVSEAVREEGISQGWTGLLRRGAEKEVSPQFSLAERRRHWKDLEEFGLTLDSGVNEFAAAPMSLDAIASTIVTKTTLGAKGLLPSPLAARTTVKALGALVGPSITRSSPTGKLVSAYQSQTQRVRALADVAMSGAYDRHIGQIEELTPVKNRVVPVDSKGQWLDPDTGKPVANYQEVFERPDDYAQYIKNPKSRQLIDDVNQMTNDEVSRLLADVGIFQRNRLRPDNEYYVPRNVKEIRGVDVSKPGMMNPQLRLHYNEITEGQSAGIKYGTNPREDIQLYMTWAYRKLIKKQLDDSLAPHGLTKTQMLPQHIQDTLVGTAKTLADTIIRGRKLAGAVRMEVGKARTLTREAKLRTRYAAELDADLVRLRRLLEYIPDLLRIGDTPTRQELEAAQRGLKAALRLERQVANEVASSRALVARTTGVVSGREQELNRLTKQHIRLLDARDDLVQSSHRYTGEAPPGLASEIRQADQAQTRFRTLGPEETQARRAAERIEASVGTLNQRRNKLIALADSAEDDLKAARELSSEATSRLRYATSAEGGELVRRGAARGRTTTLNQEVQRLVRRIDRAGRQGAKMRDKQAAQATVLDFVKGQQDQIKKDLIEHQKSATAAKAERAKKLEEIRATNVSEGALWGPNQPDTIAVARWHQRFFSLEDAQLLSETITAAERRNWLTQGVQSLVNVKRALTSTGDAAEPFIQGLPLLAANPKAWSLQTARHYQALFDPTIQSRRIADNMADFQWLARNGVPIGDLEFFAAIQTGEGVSFNRLFRLLPKGEEVQRYFRTGGKQSFGRFGAMYNTGLSEARLQLLQATRPGWKGTDAELAQFIRNMTGGLESRALGISPGRTAAEGFWLAYSPRLLKSTTALLYDAFSGGVPLEILPKALKPISPRLSRGVQKRLLGGIEADVPVYDIAEGRLVRDVVGGYASTPQGRRALRILATLAGGVVTTYIVTGMALGKSWDDIKAGLNPLNGKRFLSHQINGDWIGVGGQIRAFAQMISAIALDPSSLTTTTRRDNPILAFLTGRGAIGFQGVLQVGEAVATSVGGEANLDPFERIDGWIDLGKVQSKGSLPFVVQGFLEGEKPLTLGASATGLRTSPWTEYDGMKDNRGVQNAQLKYWIATENIVPSEPVQMEWQGETFEFDMPEGIATFADLQPHEKERFRARFPGTFTREEELLRAAAEKDNADDWVIRQVKSLDSEALDVKEQEDQDAAMNATPPRLGVEEWKTNYQRLKYTAIVRRQEDDYDKDEITKPLDIYYAKMEELQTIEIPATGAVGLAPMTPARWEALEVWVSQQPEWFQTYVDDNTGLSAPTAETTLFKNAETLLREQYWGKATLALAYPENHSEGNVPIWSERGVKYFDVTSNQARLYRYYKSLTDRARTDWITVLHDERGTEMEQIKNMRKDIVYYVGRQLSLYKRQIRTENLEVQSAVYKYYQEGTSAEARFIQDFREKSEGATLP